jgi:hypothetical protein
MKPNFESNFGMKPFGYEGAGKLGISTLEGTNLDVLQREVNWNLEERKKQMNGYLRANGLKINEKAIHNRIEKIMNLDTDSLDALEKEVNAKLEQKKMELERKLKSL